MFRFVVALLAIEATVAHSTGVSPVEKVITMLEDLQTQVVAEGRAEAKTYDAFACFCKDVTDEKSTAITSGQDEQQSLMADIEAKTAERETLDTTIASTIKRLGEIEKEISDTMAARHKEKIEYDRNLLDMEGAIQALQSAIATMKASKTSASLAAMGAVLKTVRKATLIADALNIGSPKSQRVLSALLQESEVPTSNYDFHSGEIIETLEKLLVDFKDERSSMDEEEVKSVAAHDKVIQALTSEREGKEKELDTAKSDKASLQEALATKSQDLSTVSATLLDDQQYLQDLAAKCESKAKGWDTRSKVRTEELSALTEAISIIKGTVTEKTTDKTIRFVQRHADVSHESMLANTEDIENDLGEDDNDELDEVNDESDEDNTSVGFLQLSKPRALLSALTKQQQKQQATSKQSEASEMEMRRVQVVSLLRSEGRELRSALLSKLASKVAADPFLKVKKLIQELIERLLQESADEASHKGWCDTEMGKAKQTRGYKADEITKLNSRLASSEAHHDKLSEQISVLEKEVKELDDELAKAGKLRKEEEDENTATVEGANEGKKAVAQAIDILSKFYKTAAKGSTAELLQGVDDDAPDAGFEGDYKGASGAAGGIIGMLEVIQSDFQRTVSETEKAEADAKQDFMEFERTTKVSLSTKNVALKEKGSELTRTGDSIAADNESLAQTQGMLDKALEELQELHGACIDTGMSYAERTEMREQETEALKKALCILDEQGPVQTESC